MNIDGLNDALNFNERLECTFIENKAPEQLKTLKINLLKSRTVKMKSEVKLPTLILPYSVYK